MVRYRRYDSGRTIVCGDGDSILFRARIGASRRQVIRRGKGDRDEERGVVDTADGVGLAGLKVDELAGAEKDGPIVGREGDGSFKALDCGLASGLVGGDHLASRDYQPDDFEILLLEQGRRPRRTERRAERTDVDTLIGRGMCDRHR